MLPSVRELNHFLALAVTQSYHVSSDAPRSMPMMPPMSPARSARSYTRYSDVTVITELKGNCQSWFNPPFELTKFWQLFLVTAGPAVAQPVETCSARRSPARWWTEGRPGRWSWSRGFGSQPCPSTEKKCFNFCSPTSILSPHLLFSSQGELCDQLVCHPVVRLRAVGRADLEALWIRPIHVFGEASKNIRILDQVLRREFPVYFIKSTFASCLCEHGLLSLGREWVTPTSTSRCTVLEWKMFF